MFLATHGVLRRGSAYTPPVLSDTYSFEFDGVNDKLTTSPQLGINGVFTLTYWFKFTGSFSTNSECFPWGCHNNNSSYLKLVSASQVQLKLNGTIYTVTESGGNNISQNTWTQFTVVRNSANSVQIYVDGYAFGASFSSGNSLTFSSIGRIVNASLGFKGLIDEPAIIQTDLTSDVLTMFNNGIPYDISSYSPTHWWREENGTFSSGVWTVTNSGSETQTLTSSGMTLTSRVTDVPT